ncbi:MAG: hypothetical protein F4X02_10470 [Chloroflexi bacterium]|nr:hypothetical protein [Chloroflexota bacterium]
MNEKLVPIDLRRLKILEWEEEFRNSSLPEHPSAERLLDILCSRGTCSDLSAFKERYSAVSAMDQDLGVLIREPGISANLVEPLRESKMNFLLGNFVSSIALCGVVAEMLAILIYNMNIHDKNKRNQFDSWSQHKRIRELKEEGFIEDRIAIDLNEIREIRKSSLHRWNRAKEDTTDQALQAYAAAARLVRKVAIQEFKDGKCLLNSDLIKYLEDENRLTAK